ncbi:outermembrane protein [Fulvivirga imtechensis AK7]|uniref:Outermembrane protein n=1 Tax=Fulvivirga imtechensis AK7 TaxID=1237149 RepID=L8JNV7_9BACT|nr:hypothetical protein [Fulvivirga imtechensis]ELR69062.1 outermembrane protein [Fulvivirga imtechensis AK7]
MTNIIKTSVVVGLLFFISCTADDADPPAGNDQKDLSEAENIEVFPSSHPLNEDISQKPIDVNSSKIINNIGPGTGLFTDFGSGTWEGAPIGIPYVVVGANQPEVAITYRANDYDGNYGDESDPGPFPIPLDAPVEGNGKGDSHVISVDVASGILYELYNASRTNDGWGASSGALFDLNKVEFRPETWTSADAAGLPIFPLLVRYPEIEKGEIDHAIRFTLPKAKIYGGYVHPARHKVSDLAGDDLLPFGAKLRLKADYDISGFSPTNQIILNAMKKYGIILADVGSSMYLSGAPHESWNNDDLRELRDIKAGDFEV